MKLKTRTVRSAADIKSFFDQIAGDYTDRHGEPDRLLEYRISIIRRLTVSCGHESLLEIGCGTAIHCLALANDFKQVVGTDFSGQMIEKAEQRRRQNFEKNNIEFAVDPAEELATVRDDNFDVVLCVGALEHMLDKPAVLLQVARVLKPGGAFVLLTLNENYLWYRWFAPWLGLQTRHLSTDTSWSKNQLAAALAVADLVQVESGYWTFIPKGDMKAWNGWLLTVLDVIGRFFTIARFRGGIYCKALKPSLGD